MRLVLQVESGPHAQERFWIGSMQSLTVGRTELADVALPRDPHMSSLHFAVACGSEHCHLQDLGSTNGTLVNGQKVTQTQLRDGDRILAGHTLFAVRIEGAAVSDAEQGGAADLSTPEPRDAAPPKQASAINGWYFDTAPEHWERLEGIGFRRSGEDEFPCTFVVIRDQLSEAERLGVYIERQLAALREHFHEFEATAPEPCEIPNADEAMRVELRHVSDDGQPVVQRQFYVRKGNSVGIATATATASEMIRVESDFTQLLSRGEFLGGGPDAT